MRMIRMWRPCFRAEEKSRKPCFGRNYSQAPIGAGAIATLPNQSMHPTAPKPGGG